MHLPGLLGLWAFRCPRALRASSPAPKKALCEAGFGGFWGFWCYGHGEEGFRGVSSKGFGNQFLPVKAYYKEGLWGSGMEDLVLGPHV